VKVGAGRGERCSLSGQRTVTLLRGAKGDGGVFHRFRPLGAGGSSSGCLRSYVIDPKGKEHIIQFAPETWWLADATSLMTGTASPYFIDAIEDSELLRLAPRSHQMLVEKVPGYAASFRAGLQKHAAAKDLRIASTLQASAEERYVEFLDTYPSIAARVPQWMLASYLGVSPETLSRIRKGFARR
jgi:CRP-like cAMP-binding protein